MNTIEEWKKDFKEYVNGLSLLRDDYKGIMEYIDEVPTVEIVTNEEEAEDYQINQEKKLQYCL